MTNQTYTNIGQRIAELRKQANLTQEELAKQAGFQTGTALSLIESGKRNIQVDGLTNIAQILGVSVEYLITGEKKSVSVPHALRSDDNLNDKEKTNLLFLYQSLKDKHGKK